MPYLPSRIHPSDQSVEEWIDGRYVPASIGYENRWKVPLYFVQARSLRIPRLRCGALTTGFIRPESEPATQCLELLAQWRQATKPVSSGFGQQISNPVDPLLKGWRTHAQIKLLPNEGGGELLEAVGDPELHSEAGCIPISDRTWCHPGAVLFREVATTVQCWNSVSESEIGPIYLEHCVLCLWPEVRVAGEMLEWRVMMSIMVSFNCQFFEPARIREGEQKEIGTLTVGVLKYWAGICQAVRSKTGLTTSTPRPQRTYKSNMKL